MKTILTNKATGPSNRQLRSWINRQRTLATPSWQYIEWLRKTYTVTCEPTITKATNESITSDSATESVAQRIRFEI